MERNSIRFNLFLSWLSRFLTLPVGSKNQRHRESASGSTLLPPSFSMATHAQCFALYTNQSLFVDLNVKKAPMEQRIERWSGIREEEGDPPFEFREKREEISTRFFQGSSTRAEENLPFLLHRCPRINLVLKTFLESPFSRSFKTITSPFLISFLQNSNSLVDGAR